MRPPDGLAWAVIATALLWFADQQWPTDSLRIISWNAAFALAGLYWVNGLSIAGYAIAAFRPNPFMIALLAVAAVLMNFISLLAIVGLFDTWGDFRRKIDEVLAARELREHSGDDSA